MGEIAHKLLESYVKTCGVDISRMIRASVESRDWLRSPEPRQVRAVMRRVVEEITRTDKMVSGKKRMMRWWFELVVNKNILDHRTHATSTIL